MSPAFCWKASPAFLQLSVCCVCMCVCMCVCACVYVCVCVIAKRQCRPIIKLCVCGGSADIFINMRGHSTGVLWEQHVKHGVFFKEYGTRDVIWTCFRDSRGVHCNLFDLAVALCQFEVCTKQTKEAFSSSWRHYELKSANQHLP